MKELKRWNTLLKTIARSEVENKVAIEMEKSASYRYAPLLVDIVGEKLIKALQVEYDATREEEKTYSFIRVGKSLLTASSKEVWIPFKWEIKKSHTI